MGAGGSVLKKGPAPNTLEFPKPKHQRLKRTRDLSLDDFEQGVTLGMGSYGRVRYYEERASSVPWAIKALRKTQVMRLSQEEHVILECDLLKSLRHPFIVRYYDRIIDKVRTATRAPRGRALVLSDRHTPRRSCAQATTKLYIVMENCSGGDLASLIKRYRQQVRA